MAMWKYGNVELWQCGNMAMWQIWQCGNMAMWQIVIIIAFQFLFFVIIIKAGEPY